MYFGRDGAADDRGKGCLLNGAQRIGLPYGKHKIRFLLHKKYKTQV